MLDRRSLIAGAGALGAALALGAGPARALSAHDFEFTSIEGDPMPLSAHAGKAILFVNTASQCGFTPQYDGLQALWEEYRDQGLVVIAAPSDDFGGQEFDEATQVKEFCAVNFNLDFPMTDIIRVRGPEAHPFYRWAIEQAGPQGAPRWNFHKFLIGPDGGLRGWFPSMRRPMSAEIRAAVEAALPGA